PGNGLYVRKTLGSFTQGLAQHEDVLREITLLDKLIGPDLLHQHVLLQEMSFVPHQDQKRVQSLRWQGHQSSITQEHSFAYIQAERTKLVKTVALFHKPV